MTLVFITEARYTKNKNQKIYYENTSFAYQLWENYLDSFDEIVVVARVHYDENHDASKAFIAEGERVRFIELPYFVGLKEYLLNSHKLKRKLKKILNIDDAVYLIRVPGNVGHTSAQLLKSNQKKYGVEVVGDLWDVYAPGVSNHPLRPIVRYLSYKRLKYDVYHSSASLFVTQHYLQKRYPPAKNSFTVAVSDVVLNKDDYFSPEERSEKSKESFKILSIGSLQMMYKSPNILLKAVQIVISKGYDVHLDWLGDGQYRDDMQNLAVELGISENVKFHGNVGKDDVKTFLKQADLFALISQTEGLPKAMVEAMAMSLPCIGTDVGGIPELIDNECIVPKNDTDSTAELIVKFLKDDVFYTKQSTTNYEKAKRYDKQLLDKDRNHFLNYLIERNQL